MSHDTRLVGAAGSGAAETEVPAFRSNCSRLRQVLFVFQVFFVFDCPLDGLDGLLDVYLFLEVWPARQAKNAAAACSRSSTLLSRRRGCLLAGGVTMGVPLFTSSTPRRRIRLRCFIRDQFVRPVMTPIDHHSKAAVRHANRRLLSAPNDAL